MATSSMTKEFVIKNEEALERLLKSLEEAEGNNTREYKKSPSLEKGEEKLKQFSFR